MVTAEQKQAARSNAEWLVHRLVEDHVAGGNLVAQGFSRRTAWLVITEHWEPRHHHWYEDLLEDAGRGAFLAIDPAAWFDEEFDPTPPVPFDVAALVAERLEDPNAPPMMVAGMRP